MVLASCSAPTYFPATKMQSGHDLVDGGVTANNPTKLAFDKAIEMGYKPENIVIVSVGTG